MIANEFMIQVDGHSYCDFKNALKDCCSTDFQFYTDDHLVNITFSKFEIGHLLDYWFENLNLDLRYDLYNLANGYKNTSIIPPKNEVGVYKYVQSFLL